MATNARTIEGAVDRSALEQKVKEMYRRVAVEPSAEFHFAMARPNGQPETRRR